ncbi:hypothetical protein BKA80DRAFT_117563, partial [Phyllosticta citrichinensis]
FRKSLSLARCSCKNIKSLLYSSSPGPVTLQPLTHHVALRLINHAPRLHVPIRATTPDRPRSRAGPPAPAARRCRGRRDCARHQDCRSRRARRAPGGRAQGPKNVDAAAEDGLVGAARPCPPGSLRKLAAAAAAPGRRQASFLSGQQRALLARQACFVGSFRLFVVVVLVFFSGREVLLAFIPAEKGGPVWKKWI